MTQPITLFSVQGNPEDYYHRPADLWKKLWAAWRLLLRVEDRGVCTGMMVAIMEKSWKVAVGV